MARCVPCKPCKVSAASGSGFRGGAHLWHQLMKLGQSEGLKAQVAKRDIVGFCRTKGEEEGTSMDGQGRGQGSDKITRWMWAGQSVQGEYEETTKARRAQAQAVWWPLQCSFLRPHAMLTLQERPRESKVASMQTSQCSNDQ